MKGRGFNESIKTKNEAKQKQHKANVTPVFFLARFPGFQHDACPFWWVRFWFAMEQRASSGITG